MTTQDDIKFAQHLLGQTVPDYVIKGYLRQVNRAKGETLFDEKRYGNYKVRIEAWSPACIESHYKEPVNQDEDSIDQAHRDALDASFESFLNDFRKEGYQQVYTDWVDNQDTEFGSSVTLFKKVSQH